MKGNHAHTAKVSRPPDVAPPGGVILPFAFTLTAAAYFVWFGVQTPRRVELLRLATQDPFALVAEWFGPAGTPLGLLDRVPVMALAALILLAAFGMGRLVIDRLWLASGCTELERIVFALAAGLSGLSTIVLLVGLAGGLRQAWLLWVLTAVLSSIGGWQVYRSVWPRNATEGVPHSTRNSAIRYPQSALAWLALPFALILLLGACLPPWDFDVREYHLQVPKEWLQQGRITFLPHNVYGNMPLGAEMHALLAMALWPGDDGPGEHGWFYGGLAGNVVIASFALVTTLGVAAAGYRVAGKPGAMLAALVLISHPWLIHVSVSGLNDGVLACYVFLAIYTMWLARRGACSFLLPGLFAGAAAAVKYPGLVFAVAPLVVWCCLPSKAPTIGRGEMPATAAPPDREKQDAHRPGTLTNGQGFGGVTLVLLFYLSGVFLGGGAWYIKNAALAGNPVYPLAYGIFGGATRTPEKVAQWSQAHQVPPDNHGWRYSPRQFAGSLAQIAGRDDLASPLILPLLAAAGLAAFAKVGPSRREGPAVPASAAVQVPDSVRNLLCTAAVAVLWILAVWWLVSHRLSRFLLPAWPFAAVLAAAAMRIEDRWWRRAVYLVALVGSGYCLLAAGSQLVGDNRWFVSLEQLRRDEPWPEGTPPRIKPGHRFLNEHVQPGQAVLLVGDAEPYDIEKPVYYNTCFDDCLLCNWMLSQSPAERRQELAQRSIAWVLVDWPEVARYQSPGNYGFDSRFSARMLEELIAQGILGTPRSLQGVELYPVLAPTSSPAR